MKTVIKSKQLIVDAGKPPIANGVLIVEGERVLEAGKIGSVAIPADSQVIDCTGDTVMPGMIDTHTHITANNKFKVPLDAHYTLDLSTAIIRGTVSLRDDLASGVTTMRALGDRGDVEVRFRDAIARDEIPGPRLVICVNALRPSHGTASFLAVVANGPAEIQDKIRENFSMGAQCVKVFATNVKNGDAFLDYIRGDLTGVAAYSKVELEAAAREAHTLGMKIAAHAIGGPGMRWCMETGIDSVEHANLLEAEDLEYFEKYGTFLSDPNLQLFFDEETGFETFETWKHDWWRAKVLKSRELTAKYMPELVKRGGKICLATDSTHASLWREAKHFTGIGVSTRDTLLAVTKNGAELLGLADETGTLEAGKFADVISVHGDPLSDITALRNVNLVMKAGKRYEHLLA